MKHRAAAASAPWHCSSSSSLRPPSSGRSPTSSTSTRSPPASPSPSARSSHVTDHPHAPVRRTILLTDVYLTQLTIWQWLSDEIHPVHVELVPGSELTGGNVPASELTAQGYLEMYDSQNSAKVVCDARARPHGHRPARGRRRDRDRRAVAGAVRAAASRTGSSGRTGHAVRDVCGLADGARRGPPGTAVPMRRRARDDLGVGHDLLRRADDGRCVRTAARADAARGRRAVPARPSGRRGSALGLEDGTAWTFPVAVSIDTAYIGGPSAGLAMTLGVMDALSQGLDHRAHRRSRPPARSTRRVNVGAGRRRAREDHRRRERRRDAVPRAAGRTRRGEVRGVAGPQGRGGLDARPGARGDPSRRRAPRRCRSRRRPSCAPRRRLGLRHGGPDHDLVVASRLERRRQGHLLPFAAGLRHRGRSAPTSSRSPASSRAAERRIAELREHVADAERRAAHPVLDEETLTSALGSRSALRSCRAPTRRPSASSPPPRPAGASCSARPRTAPPSVIVEAQAHAAATVAEAEHAATAPRDRRPGDRRAAEGRGEVERRRARGPRARAGSHDRRRGPGDAQEDPRGPARAAKDAPRPDRAAARRPRLAAHLGAGAAHDRGLDARRPRGLRRARASRPRSSCCAPSRRRRRWARRRSSVPLVASTPPGGAPAPRAATRTPTRSRRSSPSSARLTSRSAAPRRPGAPTTRTSCDPTPRSRPILQRRDEVVAGSRDGARPQGEALAAGRPERRARARPRRRGPRGRRAPRARSASSGTATRSRRSSRSERRRTRAAPSRRARAASSAPSSPTPSSPSSQRTSPRRS